MEFSDSSLLSKVGLVVNVVGVIFTIIGFPTNYWDSVTFAGVSSHTGLFKVCSQMSLTTGCVDIPSANLDDWMVATRAMVILGFLTGLGGVALLVVHMIVKGDLKILNMAALGATFAAAVFVLLGIIIYGAKRRASILGVTLYLGWSFVLTTIGGVIHLIAGVILLVDKVVVKG